MFYARGTIFALSAILSSTCAAGELETPIGQITEAYNSIDSVEVSVSGAIGTVYGDTLYFQDNTGRYAVVLDAGRAARKSLEGCEINPFVSSEQQPCSIVGMAEIDVELPDDNWADGAEISLIIYELELTRN